MRPRTPEDDARDKARVEQFNREKRRFLLKCLILAVGAVIALYIFDGIWGLFH